MLKIALTIAGSDPSGGAGIQADLKTFHRFGVYGEAVIALLTAQNTEGIQRVEVVPPDLVAEQILMVLADIPPHAAKIGALGSVEVVKTVARIAETFDFPLVVDTVMASKNGAPLLDRGARTAVLDKLAPLAFLLTPNLDEAEALTSTRVRDLDGMARAAEKLVSAGAKNVLVKGGHLDGDPVDLLLASSGEYRQFGARRAATRHTHGAGCTYSAAITAQLALGQPLTEAIACAKSFITEAIRRAAGLGRGAGPLNHFA
ncbi:MAG TPA: bifunctional hydroxymethylpyrimidine kinase/phosphomethylpyrimidine kinase [Bryobacteraceae bacterium]|nr:bifunctional hydroxymethylpyrimidine kinase/phosphomethylpyrimidine kinase [Bryobacteraceae bacterium]